MSDLTAALYQALEADLEGYLDPFQLGMCASGRKLWPDATIEQAQCYALSQSLFKKYNDKDRPSPDACRKALEKFLDVNVRCRDWVLHLSENSLAEYERDQELVGGVRAVLWDFWNEDGYPLVDTYEEIHSVGSVGPGASRGARGTDMYTKVYDSSLTATSESLLFVWEKLSSCDPRWMDAETLRSQRYGRRIVQGNKLSFVNKNVTVARCISTEPTINMWFQLGLGTLLERRIKRFFGIDLSNQPEINGYLARVGSRYGGFATIDLESASDSVSLGMAKAILPPDLFGWLERLRSPTVELPNGSVEELNMVSTMGNGFTFPLQTAIFLAVVASVYRYLGVTSGAYGPGYMRTYGVFGDDIIVLTEAANLVIHTLGLLGFRVNAGKSFVEGPFRESCGHDWYQGSWCRGVYIKRLKTTQDYCVALNNLNRWSAITGIRLPNLVAALMSLSPQEPLRVPPDEPDDAGLHVPLSLYKGWDRRVNVPWRHGLVAYRCYRARSLGLKVTKTGDIVIDKQIRDDGVKHRMPNESGLLLAFLAGYIRGYRITLRQRRARYTTKPRVTSSWDTLAPQCRHLGVGWSRFEAAVLGNQT